MSAARNEQCHISMSAIIRLSIRTPARTRTAGNDNRTPTPPPGLMGPWIWVMAKVDDVLIANGFAHRAKI